MKRRAFIKKSAITAGLVGSSSLLLTTASGCKENTSQNSGRKRVAKEEIRSEEYLKRVRSDKSLTKKPVFAESFLPEKSQIRSMPLKERLKRNIVPGRGFCSLAPGGETLSSGNGSVNIEVAGNPYTEQIPFSHESLFAPRKKSLEAPKIANVFPQVRQMILDGKYHEAAMVGYNEWRKNPVTRAGGAGGGRISLLMESPGTNSVKDYLRTVDFESTEVKVH